MTVTPCIDPARLLEEQLAQVSPELLRELLTTFINTLMSAEVDAVCGAAYGQASPDRTWSTGVQPEQYREVRDEYRLQRRKFGGATP
jgi:transposase-like protein